MNQQAFTFDEPERNVRDVGQATFAIAVEGDVGDSGFDFFFEQIAQALCLSVASWQFRNCEFSRCAKSYNVRHGLSARAPFTFLMPTDLLRQQTHAATDKKRTR